MITSTCMCNVINCIAKLLDDYFMNTFDFLQTINLKKTAATYTVMGTSNRPKRTKAV